MIRNFYDTEFLETGSSIDLISIAIVTSDGREYYAVNADMPVDRIKQHHWLTQHVWPRLPLRDTHPAMNEPPGPFRTDVPMAGRCRCKPQDGLLDTRSTLVKPKWVIANEVREFLLGPNKPMELWTYFGAYDHVVMSWLWGSMANRPQEVPMFSHDLMQFASSLGLGDKDLPAQASIAHNALDDARWTQQAWKYLDEFAKDRESSGRCISCDHQLEFHSGSEGCRYTVTHGSFEVNLVCPCAGAPVVRGGSDLLVRKVAG